MLNRSRYPKINIRSKNEIAKHISDKNLPYPEALDMVNDVMSNFDKYWYDSKSSEPAKEKFVRSAVGTPLGSLLKKIDRTMLSPYDNLLPSFVFGGVANKSHIQADYNLLGSKRKRILLRLDVKKFFEQISEERVFYFFYKKCGCSVNAAKLLASLCCVPLGPKGSKNENKSIARGFATSSRLAVWCNVDIFLKLNWKIRRLLRKHDPRLSIFVDDIGISASEISAERMQEVSKIIESLLVESDKNQSLPINSDKKDIRLFSDGAEHLGLRLGRNKLSIGWKAQSKKNKVLKALEHPGSKLVRKKLLEKKKSYYRYKQQVSSARLNN